MNLYLLANFFEADLQVGKSMIIFVQHERANVAFKGIVKNVFTSRLVPPFENQNKETKKIRFLAEKRFAHFFLNF
jgi:hypothetical protein